MTFVTHSNIVSALRKIESSNCLVPPNRIVIEPFLIAATTVVPTDGSFNNASSFLRKREHRGLLPQIHKKVYSTVLTWGLDQLYRFSVLAMAYQKIGSSPQEMKILAAGGKESGDEFPFSDLILGRLRSFAPAKWPNPAELQQAQQFWRQYRTFFHYFGH
jgi:hypothetical protein